MFSCNLARYTSRVTWIQKIMSSLTFPMCKLHLPSNNRKGLEQRPKPKHSKSGTERVERFLESGSEKPLALVQEGSHGYRTGWDGATTNFAPSPNHSWSVPCSNTLPSTSDSALHLIVGLFTSPAWMLEIADLSQTYNKTGQETISN